MKFFVQAVLWAVILTLAANESNAQSVRAPHIEVELISEHDSLVPGGTQDIALRMRPQRGWHVYWKYHGDSGSAPTINFNPIDNIEIGEIQWPYPERISVAHLVNYGYSEEVLFLIPVKTSKDMQPGDTVHFNAQADWLVCEEECIPGEARLELKLAVKEAAQPTVWVPRFEETRKALPISMPDLNISSDVIDEQQLLLQFKITPGLRRIGYEITFFPNSAMQIENAAPQKVSIEGDQLRIKLQKSRFNPFPKEISGILVSENGWTENYKQALEFSTMLNSALAPVPHNDSRISLLSALLFAFIGGIILNLMPCVFPVISIKILGFVKKAGEERKKVFMHGVFFAAGVLISFWTLAFTLILLQQAGLKLGWGFQLQSPAFLIFMIFLLYIVGLNFLGFFEIGTTLQHLAGRYSAKGYHDSFLSGILATLLATPCTAPFMGTAIAFSLSSSGFVSFMVFTSLALGMAFPYVLLSASPRLLSYIPKPGVWMERLKQLLSFPIFATVAWLLGVFFRQVGIENANTIIYSLVILTFAVWVLVNIKRFAKLTAAMLFVLAFYLSVPAKININEQLEWLDFSNKVLEQYVSENKPVFIDFTADWCLTCKLNKYVALDRKEVIEKFKEKGVIMLRADWTSVDGEISDALKSYDRRGVPTNVLYYGDENKTYYVFPTVLTPAMLMKELRKIN